jgi:hypothetical protein
MLHAMARQARWARYGALLATISLSSALLQPRLPCALHRVHGQQMAACWCPSRAALRLGARRRSSASGTGWRASAGSLFEPTYESHVLYQQAEEQMRALHSSKCTDEKAKQKDEAFWTALEDRLPPEDPDSSLWRFRHFLTKQRIIALPLTGRTRIEGVSRLSLGPLTDMDDGRRQVRALAYYPGLSHQPLHDFEKFTWLRTLNSHADVIREELDAYLQSPASKWAGNNCQDFDQYGWTQISFNTFGVSHSEPVEFFPKTLALLAQVDAPFGPRDLCIVRQEGKSGLPRHRYAKRKALSHP